MKKVILFGTMALMVAACGNKSEKAEPTAPVAVEEKAKNVRIMDLESSTIDILEETTATINAFEKVYLAPTIAGRIHDVKVDVNDMVKENQLVVEMDDAQLKQMKVQLDNLEKEMVRMDTLIQYGSVSEQIYDQTKMQYETLKVNYQNMLDNTRMSSPIDGIVTERYFDNNEIYGGAPNTQVGKAAILVVEQINKLEVVMNMSSRYFPLVKKGLEARLFSDIYPDKEFYGEVSLVYPTIDPMTRTFTVEITIPNKDLILRPGMYAKVQVKLGEKDALVVPSSAVLMQDGTANRFIFINNDGVAQRVPVELGARFDDRLEILSEIDLVGKQLVVAGQSKLNNGDKIAIN